MFISLLELILGASLIGVAGACLVLDNRWLAGRIDNLNLGVYQFYKDENARIERLEDWIKHLDERTRRQVGALPIAEPQITVAHTDDQADAGTVPTLPDTDQFDPTPPTVPDLMPLAVQSALIEARPVRNLDNERPHPTDSDERKAKTAAYIEERLKQFDFSGRRK